MTSSHTTFDLGYRLGWLSWYCCIVLSASASVSDEVHGAQSELCTIEVEFISPGGVSCALANVEGIASKLYLGDSTGFSSPLDASGCLTALRATVR
jgi:hypothetical protein